MASTFVMARQPILDTRERFYGYELLFRPEVGAVAAGDGDGDQMALATLGGAFMDIGQQVALGRYRGFVNLTREVLLSDVIEALPPRRIVLEVLETVAPSESVRARCQDLRRKGYTVALDDYVDADPRESLLDVVDLVKVDIRQVRGRDLERLARQLHAARVDLLAEKVETREEYERCVDLGFRLFQGLSLIHI